MTASARDGAVSVKYQSLQAARALAATGVCLFHLGEAMSAENNYGIAWPSKLFGTFGSAGVEFFFVLSGFIIYTAHRGDLGKPSRLPNYAWKRFVRIYPTIWILFGAPFLAALVLPSVRETMAHSIPVYLKSLLLIPQDDGHLGSPVIVVAWTLHYEMLFYIAFGLLILNRPLGLIAGILGLIASFVLWFVAPKELPLSFFSRFHFIILFAFGVVVSVLHHSGRLNVLPPAVAFLLGLLGFLAIGMADFFYGGWLAEGRVILLGVASLLTLIGLIQFERNGVVLGRNRWLQLLGEASYVLYLIHFPLITPLMKACVALGLPGYGLAGALAGMVLVVAVVLVVSCVFHVVVEKKVITYLNGLQKPKKADTNIAAAGTA